MSWMDALSRNVLTKFCFKCSNVVRSNNEITTPPFVQAHMTSLPANRCKALTGLVFICNSDTYIGAETYYNLFTVRKNSDASTYEDRVSVCIFLCVLRSVNFVYGCVTLMFFYDIMLVSGSSLQPVFLSVGV